MLKRRGFFGAAAAAAIPMSLAAKAAGAESERWETEGDVRSLIFKTMKSWIDYEASRGREWDLHIDSTAPWPSVIYVTMYGKMPEKDGYSEYRYCKAFTIDYLNALSAGKAKTKRHLERMWHECKPQKHRAFERVDYRGEIIQ